MRPYACVSMNASLMTPHLCTRWPAMAAVFLLAGCGGPADPEAPGDDPNAIGTAQSASTLTCNPMPTASCNEPIWNTGSDNKTPLVEGTTPVGYTLNPVHANNGTAFNWDDPINLEQVVGGQWVTHRQKLRAVFHEWEVLSGGAVTFTECPSCSTRIEFRACDHGTSGIGKPVPPARLQYSCVAPGQGVGSAEEVGHALGLEHEQQRSDRDRYVKVAAAGCAQAGEDYRNWVATRCSNPGRDFGIYNLDSRMQYPGRQGGGASCNAWSPPANCYMTTRADGYIAGNDGLAVYVHPRDGSALAELMHSAQWSPFRLVAPSDPGPTQPLDGHVAPGVTITGSPAAVRRPGVQTGGEMVDVFVVGSDAHMYRRQMNRFPGSWESWTPYIDMGWPAWDRDPAAVLLGSGNVGVFGTFSNMVYYGQLSTNGSWNWNTSIRMAGPPPGICSAVTAVRRGSGDYVNLLVLGCDLNVYIGGLNMGEGSANWSTIPVPHADAFASGKKPGGASWGVDRLDVFMTTANNNVMWTYWTAAAGWQSKYTRVLSGALSSPSAVTTGPNRLRVFVRGTDRLARWTKWDGSTWSGLWALGGLGPGDLGVAAGTRTEIGTEGLKVYMVGDDSALWEKDRIFAVP
jgi:hypothetical protein